MSFIDSSFLNYSSFFFVCLVSLVPFLNASLVAVFLVSLFLWNLSSLFPALFIVASISFGGLLYLKNNVYFFSSAFWLFIVTEVFAFGSLFVCCLSCEPQASVDPISEVYELPFIGCFILLGSSITATAFHHSLGLSGSYKWLLLTISLGVLFIFLQMSEFRLSDQAWSDGFYYSSCFSVVGLHFTHVALGLMGLIYIFKLSIQNNVGLLERYTTLVIWYWHFVDYIWLLVYFIVYCC